MKMSFHFWRNSGKPGKQRFITLANSYHGETLGALAVGNVDLYKAIYRPLLMDVITVPSPDAFARAAGVSEADHAREMFAAMDPELDNFFHLMTTANLTDLKNREGKSPGGFCTSLSRMRATASATSTANVSEAPLTRRRTISTSRSGVG